MTRLQTALGERILVLDGAMGTMLQAAALTAADFGGPALEGCNEHLNLTRPDVVREIHRAYVEAGADCVSTNTFGCAPYVLGEYGLSDRAWEICRAAARLAREGAGEAFVLGAMGPSTRTITVTRNVTFDDVRTGYRVQAAGLIAGGADALLLETCQDTLNVKAAALGVREALQEAGVSLPLMVSATIEPTGTMLAGQGVEALTVSLEHLAPFSLGLNCSTGPEFMTDHLRSLSALTTAFTSVYPNAGLPDERGQYGETPASLAYKLRRFLDEGWVNIVGGCCGTTPAHIAAIAALARTRRPRVPAAAPAPAVSGVEAIAPTDDNRPLFVGERTNVIGSRKFKELVVGEHFDDAAEVGRAQVKAGAQVLDVCLANPDRDEPRDMDRFMGELTRRVKVPLMIDSTDAAVIELALRHCQGKAIVNSINLEDGEERFEKVCPLLQQLRRRRRRRLHRREQAAGHGGDARAEAGRRRALLPAADREVRDPGPGPDLRSAGVPGRHRRRQLHRLGHGDDRGRARDQGALSRVPDHPGHLQRVVRPAAGRAGGAQRRLPLPLRQGRPRLRDHQHRAAGALPLDPRGGAPAGRGPDLLAGRRPGGGLRRPLPRPQEDAGGAEHADARRAARALHRRGQPRRPHRGPRREAGARRCPLDIINGPLMRGMDEVGRLFNDNQLIVAEVLQSAEAMKAAVAHLEPHMEKADSASRATIVLATVKGDVHDIGKNLVDIILSNNGYRVINLGIKIPPEELLAAVPHAQAGRLRPVGAAREVGPADGRHRPGPARRPAWTSRSSWAAPP